MDELHHYDAFGMPSVMNSKQPFGFTGYRMDDIEITGSLFAQAREYNPTLGRFTSQDSHWSPTNMVYGDLTHEPWEIHNGGPDALAIRQSSNLYGYVLNNPVNYLDLDGKCLWLIPGMPSAPQMWDTAKRTVTSIFSNGATTHALSSGGSVAMQQPVVNDLAATLAASALGGITLYHILENSGTLDGDFGGSRGNGGSRELGGALGLGGLGLLGIVNEGDFSALRDWANERVRTRQPEQRNDGNYMVYIVWDSGPNLDMGPDNIWSVWYVGYTSAFNRRRANHLRNHEKFGVLLDDGAKRFNMTTVITGLTRDQARVREQALMMAFGTLGIANKIRSIAQRNWDDSRFEEEIQRLNTLFSTINYGDE